MHFNSEELAMFAESVGDHEGRLTHKPPPRTLYDSAYKERWFKLKANLLFYYRLNEFGGVDKNEPSGVFVLENIEVQREEISDAPFGFAIKWKDDMEKKASLLCPVRGKCLYVGQQINTCKDPLEHLGTPLIQRTSRIGAKCKSQFHVDLEEGPLSLELPQRPMAESSRLLVQRSPEGLRRSIHGLPSKSPITRMKISKSPSLREPARTAPVPPPRKGKKQNAGNGHAIVEDLVPGVGCNQASFQCHIEDECLQYKQNNLLD